MTDPIENVRHPLPWSFPIPANPHAWTTVRDANGKIIAMCDSPTAKLLIDHANVQGWLGGT